MIVGLLPLLYVCRRGPPALAAVAGYVCFVAAILTVCRWIYVGAVGILGPQYYAIAIVAAVAKSLPYATAAALLSVASRKAIPAWPLVAGSLFVAAEQVVSNGDHALALAVPSLSAAHSIAAHIIVPIFGAPGLTFVLVAVAAQVCDTLFFTRKWDARFAAAAVGALICSVPAQTPRPAVPQRAPTAVLMRSLSAAENGAPVRNDRRRAAMIVLPEDALLYRSSAESSAVLARVRRFAKSRGTTVIGGFAGFDGTFARNQAAIVTPSGSLTLYTKQRLITFAEYIPDRFVFERLLPIVREVKDFQRGRTFVDRKIAGADIVVRPLLCYEGVFSASFRSLQRNAVVVELSDDSWFAEPTGALQQLDALELRALENGVPIVVSGASSPSGVIDAAGTFREADFHELRTAEIGLPRAAPTFYARFRDGPLGALAVLAVLYYGFVRIRAGARVRQPAKSAIVARTGPEIDAAGTWAGR
jgi:apolipoprotein N-acyltransferase